MLSKPLTSSHEGGVVNTGDAYYDRIVNKIIVDIENGVNVFLTGPGGVGKSFAIREIVKHFALVRKKSVSVVATTGIAAIPLAIPEAQISGSTIHAWAGVGLAKESAEKLAAFVEKKSKPCQRIRATQILVIDEVSMLGADFFQKLDFVLKHIRRCPSKTFGGIVLLLVGDFYQLPPINDEWVFKSKAWKDADFQPYILDQPKRYDDKDPSWFFLQMRMRMGAPSGHDLEVLNAQLEAYQKWMKDARLRREAIENGELDAKTELVVKPTVLHSKRINVESENERELQKLKGEKRAYHAIDLYEEKRRGGGQREYYVKRLDDAIPELIILKVGAQVMLKANLDLAAGLGNGTRGVVMELGETWVKVKWRNDVITIVAPHVWTEEDKDAKMSRTAIPLILAWSLTIHKCVAGDTLVEVEGEGLERIDSYITYLATSPFRKTVDGNGKERTEIVPGWYDLQRPISIRTFLRDGKGFETVSRFYVGEEEPTIEIETSSGYRLEGSYRHPILSSPSGGADSSIADAKWTTLPELKVGDRVRLSRGCRAETKKTEAGDAFVSLPLPVSGGGVKCLVFECESAEKIGVKLLTPEVAKLFALVLGTGLYNSTPRSSLECAAARGELERVAASIFGTNLTYADARPHPYGWQRDPLILQFLKDMSCDVKQAGWSGFSKDTHVPWMIMRSGYDVQLSYVRAIFDCFGVRVGAGADDAYGAVRFTFPSKPFAAEIQTMLLSLGVRSELRTVAEWGGLYRVTVQAQEYDSVFFLPTGPAESFFDETIVKINRRSAANYKRRLFDFEVPDTHTFITNGFVSHNCQGSTLDYAIVNAGKDIFEDGQAYVALSRVQSQEGLLLSDFSRKSIRASTVASKFMDSQEKLFRENNPYPKNIELVRSSCLIFPPEEKK